MLFGMPLKEFMEAYEGDVYHGWAEYVTYGGLPLAEMRGFQVDVGVVQKRSHNKDGVGLFFL